MEFLENFFDFDGDGELNAMEQAMDFMMFEREGKIIALKCHILTGEVSEH